MIDWLVFRDQAHYDEAVKDAAKYVPMGMARERLRALSLCVLRDSCRPDVERFTVATHNADLAVLAAWIEPDVSAA